jgi:hypothetical protein
MRLGKVTISWWVTLSARTSWLHHRMVEQVRQESLDLVDQGLPGQGDDHEP